MILALCICLLVRVYRLLYAKTINIQDEIKQAWKEVTVKVFIIYMPPLNKDFNSHFGVNFCLQTFKLLANCLLM